MDRRAGGLVIRLRSHLAVLAATLTASSVVACSLDFDRYDTVDGAVDGRADSPQGMPGEDAAISDARRDSSMSAPDAPASESSGPCSPPASCLTQASSCAARCTQDYQQCVQNCHNMGCMMNCTSQE
jgi:hypothetical protein